MWNLQEPPRPSKTPIICSETAVLHKIETADPLSFSRLKLFQSHLTHLRPLIPLIRFLLLFFGFSRSFPFCAAALSLVNIVLSYLVLLYLPPLYIFCWSSIPTWIYNDRMCCRISIIMTENWLFSLTLNSSHPCVRLPALRPLWPHWKSAAKTLLTPRPRIVSRLSVLSKTSCLFLTPQTLQCLTTL